MTRWQKSLAVSDAITTLKIPKIGTPTKITCFRIGPVWFYNAVMCPKAAGIENIADPDQTAP